MDFDELLRLIIARKEGIEFGTKYEHSPQCTSVRYYAFYEDDEEKGIDLYFGDFIEQQTINNYER